MTTLHSNIIPNIVGVFKRGDKYVVRAIDDKDYIYIDCRLPNNTPDECVFIMVCMMAKVCKEFNLEKKIIINSLEVQKWIEGSYNGDAPECKRVEPLLRAVTVKKIDSNIYFFTR